METAINQWNWNQLATGNRVEQGPDYVGVLSERLFHINMMANSTCIMQVPVDAIVLCTDE